jgi:hypothetical protein
MFYRLHPHLGLGIFLILFLPVARVVKLVDTQA